MKQILFITVLFASIFNQAQAHLPVEESPIVMRAELETAEINHTWLDQTEGGNISIDVTNQEMTLTLYNPWSCPDGMACAAVMPEPEMIKLPIVRTYSDWCGATTYEAEIDSTPADGLYEILVVTDYTTLQCRIAMPYMTNIEYRTFNPWTQDWVSSHFTAEALQMQPVFFN